MKGMTVWELHNLCSYVFLNNSMNTFYSSLHFTKIAKEGSMRLGEGKSLNSKFCPIWPNVHDSDPRTPPSACFPIDLVYFLYLAASAGHAARAGLWLLCSSARMTLVASVTAMHEQGASAVHCRSHHGPEAAAPACISQMRKEAPRACQHAGVRWL